MKQRYVWYVYIGLVGIILSCTSVSEVKPMLRNGINTPTATSNSAEKPPKKVIYEPRMFVPVCADANENVKKLLNWVGNLPTRTENRVLSGQFVGHGNEIVADGPGGQWEKYVESLYKVTGKYPAMVSVDYEYANIYSIDELKQANKKLIEHWKAGGLVSINYTARNPFTGGSTRDKNFNGKTLKDLVDPSTQEYVVWHKRLDVIAEALQDLRDAGVVVFWRPMQEMNGTWFWYSTDDYRLVYIDMFEYFKKKGLNNLIWVWSLSEFWTNGVLWARYPGSEYVDIVGNNPYNNEFHMDACYETLANDSRTKDKIFAVTENGWQIDAAFGKNDNRKIIEMIRKNFPNTVWHMNWHDWGDNNKHSIVNNLYAKEFMDDPWIISRDEVDWQGVARKDLPRILVHSEGHYLKTIHDEPFFYLGDTAWEIFHKLNRNEADKYLLDRARKGFNVIQAVLLAEKDGLNTPNAYGDLPLKNLETIDPDITPGDRFEDSKEYDYWDHCDYIINRASQLGLYVGLLPTWGDKVLLKWGPGPEIFNTIEKAYNYGYFVGNRYKNYTNIIWILGGDRRGIDKTNDRREIWRAMAEGIVDGVNEEKTQDGIAKWDAVLMTYHPFGGTSSSQWFHDDIWLDFNMIQTGHSSRDNPMTWEYPASDWEKLPAKPTFDSEPCYEDHPIANKPENGWFDDFDVRKAAWRSVFSGGAGITYGANAIWQMYDPLRDKPNANIRRSWSDSLQLPGASQMIFLKNLLLSRPYFSRVPDPTLVEDIGTSHDRMAATRDANGSWAAIYIPHEQRSVKVKVSALSGEKFHAWWYSPRDGKVYDQNGNIIDKPFNTIDKMDTTFNPPPQKSDWVLILDDVSKNYGIPGKK